MSAVADTLRTARALIAKGWARGVAARDGSGEPTEHCGRKAVCWCAIGAISAATPLDWSAYRKAKDAVERAVRTPDLVCWNDSPRRTQAEVLAAFDKAIELAEANDA